MPETITLASPDQRWVFRHRAISASIFLLVAVLFYLGELEVLSKFNGWWLDELFSLTISDPSDSFRNAFVNKIITDSNPPLYYSALYAVRTLVADDGVAVLILNGLAIVVGASAIALASLRAGIFGTGLVGIAAILLSGPILRYSLEARSYLIALQITFVASWYCSLAIQCRRPPIAAGFGILGCLAALTHVYAALMCGSWAAGLITLAVFEKRRDLWAPGLALGMGAVVTTIIYVHFGLDTTRLPNWIKFDIPSVASAIADLVRLGIGGSNPLLERTNILLLAILFCGGLFSRSTRALTIAFSVALAIFVLIPIGVSFKQPIISGGYWAIGLPMITVFTIFLCSTWYFESRSVQRRHLIRVGTFLAASFIVLSDLAGFGGARSTLAGKMIWRGAPIVAQRAKNCPKDSIHIFRSLAWLYAKASGLPADTFMDVEAPETSVINAAAAKCAVLGWAEHYVPIMSHPDMSDGELLALLKIDASPAEVEVLRHWSGFVVLRQE